MMMICNTAGDFGYLHTVMPSQQMPFCVCVHFYIITFVSTAVLYCRTIPGLFPRIITGPANGESKGDTVLNSFSMSHMKG